MTRSNPLGRRLVIVIGMLMTSVTLASPALAADGRQGIKGFHGDEFAFTDFGILVGSVDKEAKTFSWLGVPYAKPPVGVMRWRAPVDPQPWGVLTAKQFGNPCVQIGSLYGPPPEGQEFGLSLRDTFGKPVGHEDCLTLNVWRPKTHKPNLPVLVFIHGGSNRTGWNGAPGYGGDSGRLAAEQDIVAVTVNYRLNLFGWLNHPALKTGDPLDDSGNFGTLDLIQALRFVKNNIANFGGDPNNITIMGQSAGSINVWSLIVSPKAAGLFHKAVPISAGLNTTSPDTSLSFANRLLQQLVIKDGLAADVSGAIAYLAGLTNAQIKSYLYGKSANELVLMLNNPIVGGIPPNVLRDGVVVPSDAVAALTNGAINNVPVMSGTTKEEGKLFTNPAFKPDATLGPFAGAAARWTLMFTFNPDDPASTPVALTDLVLPQFLPADKPQTSCADVGYNLFARNCSLVPTIFFWANQADTLNRLQPHQRKTFAYNFAWARQPEPWKTFFGAVHALDTVFIYGDFTGIFLEGFSTANEPGREALSAIMRAALGSFMRTGDPNNRSLGTLWKPWDPAPGGSKRLVLDADDTRANVSMSNADAP